MGDSSAFPSTAHSRSLRPALARRDRCGLAGCASLLHAETNGHWQVVLRGEDMMNGARQTAKKVRVCEVDHHTPDNFNGISRLLRSTDFYMKSGLWRSLGSAGEKLRGISVAEAAIRRVSPPMRGSFSARLFQVNRSETS